MNLYYYRKYMNEWMSEWEEKKLLYNKYHNWFRQKSSIIKLLDESLLMNRETCVDLQNIISPENTC